MSARRPVGAKNGRAGWRTVGADGAISLIGCVWCGGREGVVDQITEYLVAIGWLAGCVFVRLRALMLKVFRLSHIHILAGIFFGALLCRFVCA